MDHMKDLARYMKAKKLTKADMARLFGVTLQGYNNWTYRDSLPKKYIEKANKLIRSIDDENSIAETPAQYKTDYLVIEKLSTTAGMGNTQDLSLDHDTVINTLEVGKNYIKDQLGTISNPKNLKLITGIGESMKGLFKSGDTLFVDTGINKFVTEGAYVFHFDDHLWIKKLARNGKGGYTIISTNKSYKEVTVQRDDPSFKIIGMVVGVLHLEKLV